MTVKQRCNCSCSPAFCILCLWFAWGCGWETLGTVLLASAVHEIGHYALLRMFAVQVREFRIGVLGAVMEVDVSCLSYGQELLSVLAGPGMNLFFAMLFRERAYAFSGANLVLCLFNLIPLPMLDGGRALRLFLSWGLGPERGEQIAEAAGVVFSLVLGGGVSALMIGTKGSLWLLPACAASFRAVVKIGEKNKKFL